MLQRQFVITDLVH